MNQAGIKVPKSWRSETFRIALVIIACVVAGILTKYLPQSIVRGELIKLGEHRVMLSLPVFWLMPFGVAADLLYRIFNVRYEIHPTFIEGRTGVLSFSQNLVRIRYEDVRGVESDQGILGRLLNYGDVQIGTAASSGMEIVMYGVLAPKEICDMIQRERDKRLELATRERLKASGEKLAAGGEV